MLAGANGAMDIFRDFYVILFVLQILAGPLYGILGLRFYEGAMEKGHRFIAVVAAVSFAAFPTITFGQFITTPLLSQADRQEPALLGVLISLLGLVGGGIAWAIWSWASQARSGTAEKETDIATTFSDLPKLRDALDQVGDACGVRFLRLARLSEQDRKTQAGTVLAYVCSRLIEAHSRLEDVVYVLECPNLLSRTEREVKAVVATMLEEVDSSGCAKPEETIPLEGVPHLKLLH
jgi:hypothetical protein